MVYGRGAYEEERETRNEGAACHKVRRNTQRARLLDAVIDQAERNGQCAVIRPGDANYRTVRRAFDSGQLVNPFPLLYARPGFWEGLKPDEQALCMMRGAHAVHPTWTFCLYSAALAHQLSVSYRLLGRMHIRSSRARTTRSNEHIHRHYTRARSGEVALAQGLPVTSLRQTLLDCLITAPLPDALAIVDSALRVYGISKESLAEFIRKNGKRRRGKRRAWELCQLADGRAESGGESILRGIIIAEGFMPPTDLQVELPDPTDPHGVFRADMLWELPDGRCIVGELDGTAKYVDEDMRAGRSTIGVLLDERQRESHITALGMPVMRFLFTHVRKPGYVAHILQSFGIPRTW